MRGHLSYNALAAGLFSVMKARFSPGGCSQLVGTTVYGGVTYIFRRRLAALKTSSELHGNCRENGNIAGLFRSC